MLVALKPTQETIDIVAALKGRWHGSYAMCICPVSPSQDSKHKGRLTFCRRAQMEKPTRHMRMTHR